MKRLTLAAAGLLLTGALFAAEPGLASVDQAWLTAVQANDVDAIAALYAPDALMYPPDTMEAKGRDAIREDYKGLLSTMTVREAKIIPSHYETHGDTSFGWGRWTLTLVPKAGGAPVEMEGRYTAVAKKIGGKWLYVADHASAPLPPPPAK